MTIVSRFAPSPTGSLHLGHAFAAWSAHEACRSLGGRFLLRIEDIDRERCRDEFEARIIEDLSWLGITWDGPVRRQSEHFEDYRAALERLDGLGVSYPCFCSRKEIRAEIARSPSAPHGPDGALYPGTCRALSPDERAERIAAGRPYALRLDAGQAAALVPDRLSWRDRERGEIVCQPGLNGDVVLARKDTPTSYHLAVTVDDALQQVNLVTRGEDLLHSSHVHCLLQALLGYTIPEYNHHRLITGTDGRRLASRHKARTLRDFRAAGITADDLRRQVGLTPLKA